MNDNRNMILAIVLSALVLIGWSLVSDRLLPTASPPTAKVENGKLRPLPQPAVCSGSRILDSSKRPIAINGRSPIRSWTR